MCEGCINERIEKVELSSEYLVYTDGTSDGTQDKYFKNGSVEDNMKYVRSRPFTASIELVQRRFPVDVTIDICKLQDFLASQPDNIQKQVVSYTLRKYINI